MVRYLEERYGGQVAVLDGSREGWLTAVDLSYTGGDGASPDIGVKVQADAYCGTDLEKAADRSLVFYRPASSSYAFETVSDNRTGVPGWMFRSTAEELFYYRLAIAQPEDEVSTLMSEPDAVFFSELAVERDELDVLPMAATREWLRANQDRYASRPVAVGDHASWVRLVPRRDVSSAVSGIRFEGPVFGSLGPTRRGDPRGA